MTTPLRVSLTDLHGLAMAAEDVTTEIERVRLAFEALTGTPALGPDAGAGYARFHDQWRADLRTTSGAADQLAAGLRRAASGYRATDDGAGRRFR